MSAIASTHAHMQPLMWAPELWWTLFKHFLSLSLFAVGGAITMLSDMHRKLVLDEGLLSDGDFTAGVAMAQAAPGPNILFVAMIGWYSAGLGGALASLVAIMLPASVLTFCVGRWIAVRRQWPSVKAFQAGLVPLTMGLLLATGWLLSPTWKNPSGLGLTVAIALIVWRTRIPLVWLIAVGGLLGALHLV